VNIRQSGIHRQTAIGAVVALALLCAGCLGSKRSVGGSGGGTEVIPLTPALWLSPSITTAATPYKDACGESAVFLVADPLVEAVPKKLGRVFTGVTPQFGLEQRVTSAGVIEVGLGLKQIDLVIPRHSQGSYPVTVTLGLEMMFLAEDGKTLFSKKLQSVGRGEVTVTDQSCDVKGLTPIVQEAIEAVTDGLAKEVAESVRVREYAEQQRVRPPMAAARPAQQGGALQAAPVVGGISANRSAPTASLPASSGGFHPTTLTFHAIVRDESQDHMLQQDESLTIEVEVKNEGRAEAQGVEVLVGGGGALIEHFPLSVAIGNVLPGEIKRASITKRVADLKEATHGELVLSLRSVTPLSTVPTAKKFTLLVKPEKGDSGPATPDVDRLPKPFAVSKQTKTVVIAIGIGKFRDEHVPQVKYADHDAEVMAGYLRAIGGISEDRVHVLVNNFALKEDLAETFDEWLPKRVDASTVVYVYFAGRAFVDGMSGAVSLVPYDGTSAAPNRLFPVRRIQEVLARLPIQRAIMMFEVSLDPSPGADPGTTPQADWGEGADDERDHVMWMVGNRSLQGAHAYEQGKHGLFTYYMLRGLQGLADSDRDGTVVAGELCTYARSEVIHAAREQFGNAQRPLCSPPPGQGAVVRIHPMAKGNNPKPPPQAKKAEPKAEESPQALKPMDMGPKP
jgi:hypothetical protein